MHLPRLSTERRAALWGGALAAAIAAVAALALSPSPPAASAEDGRRALAAFLYGQDDPDRVIAAGLHGLGHDPVHIGIADLGDCRFAITTADARETIDFRRIADIRHAVIDDPAAGLVRSILPVAGEGRPQRLVAVLTGAEDAVCGARHCTDRRVFGLSAPERLGAAQAAAAAFRSRVCPGLAPRPAADARAGG